MARNNKSEKPLPRHPGGLTVGRTTNLDAFAIFNVGSPTRYIKRSWLTRAEAEKELASLLWPYPPKHEWRKRLEVRPCVLTPADAARIERERERRAA